MEKIATTVYATVDPYQGVTDLAHKAWKARDRRVWTETFGDEFKSQSEYYQLPS